MDGSQLVRPPQWTIANPSLDPVNIAVWGVHQRGSGNITSPATTASAWAKSAMTGTLTIVAYCDGHVKAINTKKLYHPNYVWEGGAWKGEALTNNAGWARTW